MNKALLAEVLAERTGLSKKQTEELLEQFTAVVTETLMKNEEVTLAGFGTFMPKFRSARMGVNPQRPSERIKVPAVVIPKFKAGKALKDALKQVDSSAFSSTAASVTAPNNPTPPTAV